MSAPFETTTRPNGKSYRPRYGPRVEEFYDYDGDAGVAVVGTHDLETAYRLAWFLICDLDLNPSDSVLDWWRLVPWDQSGQFERSWITDLKRGSPAVIWGTK